MGNFIDLEKIDEYVETYSLDALRYFLIKEGPLGSTDADFSANQFHETYSTDLVNTLGNCASRVSAMINKYFEGVIPPLANDSATILADYNWPKLASEAMQTVCDSVQQLQLDTAVEAAIALVRHVDAFINATEPFKLAKDETKRDELALILYQCAETVRVASLLLWPVCPDKINQLWNAFGVSIDPAQGNLHELAQWGGDQSLKPGTHIQKVALFPRVELQTAGA